MRSLDFLRLHDIKFSYKDSVSCPMATCFQVSATFMKKSNKSVRCVSEFSLDSE